MLRTIIIFVLQWAVLAIAGDNKVATMEDLEALAKEGDWAGIVKEATDVRPAARTPRWKELVEKAAEEDLKNNAGDPHPSELVSRYPFLAKSSAFQKISGEAAVKEFEKCTEGYAHHACTDRLEKFLGQVHPPTDAILKAGQAINVRFNPSEGIRAFRFGIDEKNKSLCKEEAVQHSVISALGVPKAPTLDWAKDIATKFCFAELRQAVETEIDRSGTGYVAINGCAVLKANSTLKGLRAKRCNQLLSKKD